MGKTWEIGDVLTTDSKGWRRQERRSGWGRATVTFHLEGCRHLRPRASTLGPGEAVRRGAVKNPDAQRWADQWSEHRICKACARRWAESRGPREVERVAKMLPVERSQPLDPELAGFMAHWSRRPTS